MSGNLALVRPGLEYLPSYKAALEKGWSPDNLRLEEAAKEELQKIATDPALFVERMIDLKAEGGPITLPDGSQVQRLPGFRMWLWDGELCGSIGARWQPGTNELPEHVLGHVGYAVVPWKRGRGYATQGLKLLLPMLAQYGLGYVYVTTEPDNYASQKVITGNNGVFLREFAPLPVYGSGTKYLYRLDVPPPQRMREKLEE